MKLKEQKNDARKILVRLFSIIVVILAYTVLRTVNHSPSLSSLEQIWNAAIKIFSSVKFYDNASYTMKIVMIGIGISFVGGTSLAILCSANKFLYRLIMPIVNTTKNIPSIALFPVFIVLMGIGDAPRVFVIIWNSAYPIISSTLSGLNSVDKDVIEAAQNCGANKLQMYLYIKIPLAIIWILEGLKISIGNGFIAIVVAEMLGATKGLGYMIVWSANAFKYPEMYVYILIIAFIGLLVNVVIEQIIKIVERRMFQ